MLNESAVTYSLSLLLLGDATVGLDDLQVVQLSDQRQCARLGRQLFVGPMLSGRDPCREAELEPVPTVNHGAGRNVERRRKPTPAQLPDEQLHLGDEAPGTQTRVISSSVRSRDGEAAAVQRLTCTPRRTRAVCFSARL